uniref:Craniofacial development protein 1 n=1 Tax=Myotis myotis TaxID=51298 RepID=A0A7J7SAZ6_MYOMY|nr:craniofacial development protein 1 [Myotis myotis]
MCRRSGGSPQPPLPPTLLFGLSPELCVGVSRCGPVAWPALRGSDMEEFDSEDFSSSEEDEDYVPSGGEYSEDDVSELVKEDEVDGEEQTQKTKGKKRKAQSIPARKRKQGGLSLEEEEEEDVSGESGGSSNEEEDTAAEQEEGTKSEDARKKKEDELWASFLNDVGPKSKVPSSPQVKKREETEETSSKKLLVKAEELEKPKETEKVKITKVFDFAGEEVRVTKEVDATSKEAKSFLKQNEKEKPQTNIPSTLASLPAGSGLKRSSGMSSLLGKIGAKKQKMSTLEKSKLDWESFKEEEGIGEELAIHNRGKEGIGFCGCSGISLTGVRY